MLIILLLASAAFAGQGSVQGLTLSKKAVESGETVRATATGSSPCGAVHIDWGDGTAITYATETLPVTQTHTYTSGGTFDLRAQGMGNCTGEARTRIVVKGPPPPPPAQPQITGISVEQPRDAPASERSITVHGTGPCAFTVDFGDGNRDTRTGALPDSIRHNYPAAGRYTTVVTARPPCRGTLEWTFVVGGQEEDRRAGRISAIRVRPQAVVTGAPVTIAIDGSGRCRFVVDFHDGESRTLTERLPHRLQYSYTQPGTYTIVVWAHEPCVGQGDAIVRVRRGR
jgi:hypothetical protein